MLQGLLETIKKKKIVAIMLVVGALLLIVASFLVIRSRGGKAEKPAPSDSSESSYVESSASGAEGSSSQSSPEGLGVSAGEVVADASSAVPPGPVTLTGVDISSLGLCVVLPAGTGIVDPNVPKSKEARYQPVTTLRNGKHSEVSLRFSDNTIAMSTMPVICLQGFDLGSTLPEDALYEVEAEIKNSKTYTYGEIADKVLYSAEGKLVLDVTFARTKSPQTAMDKHITKFEGK